MLHAYVSRCPWLLIVCAFNAGDYYSGSPGDLDQEPDDEWVKSRQNEGRAYQEWDEDADVDESGEIFHISLSSPALAT